MAPPYAGGSAAIVRIDGVPTIPKIPFAPRGDLPSPDIDGLATALLDLGSSYESALRTVLSMQRLLERVRRCRELSPEAALLIQEMSRQCETLEAGSGRLEACVRAASERIETFDR